MPHASAIFIEPTCLSELVIPGGRCLDRAWFWWSKDHKKMFFIHAAYADFTQKSSPKMWSKIWYDTSAPPQQVPLPARWPGASAPYGNAANCVKANIKKNLERNGSAAKFGEIIPVISINNPQVWLLNLGIFLFWEWSPGVLTHSHPEIKAPRCLTWPSHGFDSGFISQPQQLCPSPQQPAAG